MPRLSLEVPHRLNSDEVIERLRRKATAVRSEFQNHISDFQETWTDHQVAFSIKAMGMKTTGTVTVEVEKVDVRLDLPLAAMFFRGAIESRVRQELGDLLR